MPALMQQFNREVQARLLVDYLRGRGVWLAGYREGDGYTLATISPESLSDEIDAQLKQFKHEILALLCEEDLFGSRRKPRSRRRRKGGA